MSIQPSHYRTLEPNQALASGEVAKALGIEHAFLLQRTRRMMSDINNPAFIALHFVSLGDAMLLSPVAASLVAMDLDLDDTDAAARLHATSCSSDMSAERTNEIAALEQQNRALTRRLHELVQQKRKLATGGLSCP